MKYLGNILFPFLVFLPVVGCGTSTTTSQTDVDTALPMVTITSPGDGAVSVAANAKIRAAFSKSMNAATFTTATFTLTQDGVAIPATVAYANMTATLIPKFVLALNMPYTATISTGAEDVLGYALAKDYVWHFETGDILNTNDTIPPTITFINPADKAAAVATNTQVSAIFSEEMDANTLSETTFTLMQGATPIAAIVNYQNLTATLTPTKVLAPGTAFSATVNTGVKDLAGNAMTSDFTWNFQTSQLVGESQINLGAASPFAILAFNTVTNVISLGTIVTGDLGISPGSALTGFPPGQVIGDIHLGDTIAAQAKADVYNAYNDAAGREGGSILPGNISGLTFAPGLYKSSTSLDHTLGTVTLDAQGDANAVFIFQIGSTLTTIADTQVVLKGGAKANNIYWAVGSSATLGTNSSFKGTILAASAITIAHGASLEGRLIAQGAAITLDENAITVPAP